MGQLDRLREEAPVAYEALLWGLALLLVAILAHAGWVFWRTVRAHRALPSLPGAPAAPRRSAADCWRRAEALAGEGRFADALRWAFDALVLELDGRDLLRYHPAKTPAEYLREARVPPDDASRLSALVGTLYRVHFAGAPLDAAGFAAWRDDARRPWGDAPAH